MMINVAFGVAAASFYAARDPLLASAYGASMEIAERTESIRRVGFCLLSASVFRGEKPLEDVIAIGLRTVADRIRRSESNLVEEVTFVAYTVEEQDAMLSAADRVFASTEPEGEETAVELAAAAAAPTPVAVKAKKKMKMKKMKKMEPAAEQLDASDEEEGGLVLDYEQLENLLSRGCVRPEHESAGKKAVWARSLGLGDMRGEEECTLMYQVLQKSNVRLTIWHMFQLPLEVKLLVEIVSPPVRTRISSYKLYPLIFLISYHSYYNWSRRVSRIGRTTRIQW